MGSSISQNFGNHGTDTGTRFPENVFFRFPNAVSYGFGERRYKFALKVKSLERFFPDLARMREF